jgi:hypothetical protein
MTVQEDRANADWIRTFQKSSALYVRNRRCRVVPLYKVITPAGYGDAIRNKFGQIEVVNSSGAFVGVLSYHSATAWLETDTKRIQVALRGPSGEWRWQPIQAEEV